MRLTIEWAEISTVQKIGAKIEALAIPGDAAPAPKGVEELKAIIKKALPPSCRGIKFSVGVRGINVNINPDAVVEIGEIYGDVLAAMVPVMKALESAGLDTKLSSWLEKWSAPIGEAPKEDLEPTMDPPMEEAFQ